MEFGENEDTFIVDSKTVCFLCLQEKDGANGDNLYDFSFRTLFRYLKINLRKVSSSLEIPAIHSNVKFDRMDKVVSLCSTCLTEAQKFSKLFKELEMISMLIHSSLQSIYMSLESSKYNSGRVKTIEEFIKTASESESGDFSVEKDPSSWPWGEIRRLQFTKRIRQELLLKCEAQLKQCWPRVEVEKLVSKSTSAVVDVESESDDDLERSDSDVEDPALGPSAEVQRPYNCEFCNENFEKENRLQSHIVRCHVEQLFLYFKEHNLLSNTQFKTVVERIFKIMSASAWNSAMRTFKCEYCGFVTKWDQPPLTYRKHLVNAHFDGVAERIKAIQSNKFEVQKIMKESEVVSKSNLDDCIKRTGEINQNGKRIYYCSICEKTFTRLGFHKRTHGLNLLKCSYCNDTFTESRNRSLHTAKSHCDKIFSMYNYYNLSETEFNAKIDEVFEDILKFKGDPDKKDKCPFCHDFYGKSWTQPFWRRHMISMHFDFVAQKILDIVYENKSMNDETGQQMETSSTISPEQTESLPTNSHDSTLLVWFVCGSCGERFTQENTLQQHLQSCQARISQTDDKPGPATPSAGSRYKCDACSTDFSQSSSLYRHKRKSCVFRKSSNGSTKPTLDSVPLPVPIVPSTSSGSDVFNEAEAAEPTTTEPSIRDFYYTLSGRLKCKACSKTFALKKNLEIHLRDFCPLRKGRLDSSDTHHLVRFGPIVPSTSSGSDVLKEAEAAEPTTTEPSVRDFYYTLSGRLKCKACSKTFALKKNLETHLRCFCPLRKGRLDSSDTHHLGGGDRLHLSDSMHSCDLCGASFTQSGTLNRHKKNNCPFRSDFNSEDMTASVTAPSSSSTYPPLIILSDTGIDMQQMVEPVATENVQDLCNSQTIIYDSGSNSNEVYTEHVVKLEAPSTHQFFDENEEDEEIDADIIMNEVQD